MTGLKQLSLVLTVVSCCLSPLALAANAGTFYLGGAVGNAMADYSSSKCASDLDNDNGLPIACSTDTTSTGYKLLGGFNVTPNLAIEGAWADLGKLQATGSLGGLSVTTEEKTSAFSLDAVGNIDVGSGFTLSGKVGFYSAQQTASDDAGDDDSNVSSTGLNIGLRGSYAFTPNLSGRLEFERYSDVGTTNFHDNDSGAETVKYNIDLASLGLVYNF